MTRSLRSIAIVCMSLACLIALVVFARRAPTITTISDIAVGELYTLLALKGKLLVGPYSRFLWHHPGPLYFWIQAPFYALGGHTAAAMYSGAVAINLAAIAMLAWVLHRHADDTTRTIAPLVLAAIALLAWRSDGFLPSPWTAHVPVLASLSFIALAAALATGQLRMLPLLIVVGSFIAQTHVGFVPLVGVLSAGALLSALIVARRADDSSRWRMLNGCAWLLLLLWAAPIVEQLSRPTGNFVELSRFFAGDAQSGQPFQMAALDWVYALVGVLRPDYATSTGNPFSITSLSWGIPCAVLQVTGLVAVAVWAIKTGRRFTGSLAITLLTAALVGLWSTTRIRGDVMDHEILWMTGLGAMNMAVVTAAALTVLSVAARQFRFSALTSFAVLALAAGIAVQQLSRLVTEQAARGAGATVATLQTSIAGYLQSQRIRQPLFRVDNLAWGEAAGVFVQLEKAGIPFAIEDAWLPMFTDAFEATGNEDAVIAIGTRAYHDRLHSRAGTVVIVERDPLYVDAIRVASTP